jgi:hypothetical protein
MISHDGKGIAGLLVLNVGWFERIRRQDTGVRQSDFL